MNTHLKRFEGKLAVVTGASAGIGEATVLKLVQAGINVLGLARRKEKLDGLSEKLKNQPGKFYPYVTDLTKEEDIANAFDWGTKNIGPVNILINCAGIMVNTNLVEGDTKLWRKLLDTNVLGLCIATREAFKSMKNNNIDGHIIHINSCMGHGVVYFSPKVSLYPASKFAVTALTETLRQELNGIGSKIKISSISPGLVHNEFRKVANIDLLEDLPGLTSEDVAESTMYVLNTPPHVQIHELIIKPVGESF